MTKKSDPESQPKTSRRRRIARRMFIGVSVAVILLAAGATAVAFAYQNKVAPRVRLAGQPVGGLTQQQAAKRLADSEQAFLNGQVTLTYADKTWKVKPADLGVSFSNADGLDQAYQYDKTGSTASQVQNLLLAFGRSSQYGVDLLPMTDAGKHHLTDTVLASIETPPNETGLNLNPGNVTVKEGIAGKKLDDAQFVAQLYDAFVHQRSSIPLNLATFQPEVTSAEAEGARAKAAAILDGSWSVGIGSSSVTLSAQDVAGLLDTQVARDASGTATGLNLVVKDDAMKSKVDDWKSKFSATPVNAMLKHDGDTVSVAQDGKDGVTIDQDKTKDAFQQAVTRFSSSSQRSVAAVTTVVHPDVRAETLASLGITQLIGTGTTDFSGSPSNRVHNITTGAGSINGILVRDGQEFSTIATLGPIDQAHGYVSGLVIVNNQTMPADGGGLCQVSTTLFRSVLNAGLPVTARQAHSYEVSYYQRGIGPGLDATIYDPNPDFKWKNDTGHAIYVQSHISGNTLTFDLYGTQDGRSSSIDGPHTLSTTQPSGTPIYVTTTTLATGKVQLIDPPISGAKTTATYTVTRGGQVINKQTFNSSYQAMPAQYLIGPGTTIPSSSTPAPTPTPTPTPTDTPAAN